MAFQRLGVFGGTFDPPHNGHLQLASAALDQLQLHRVLWVLTAAPPHKQTLRISPAEDRLALVQAALAGQPGFQLSRVDIDRPGPHWAADTVRLLSERYPEAELVYLMGGDSLRDLPTWGRPREFLRYCRLGVWRRPGAVVDVSALERALPGVSTRVEFVDLPPVDIASSEIRRRAAAGEPMTGLVPEAVARLIAARHLYQAAGE